MVPNTVTARRKAKKEYRKAARFRALQAYGGKCACCGEDKWEFLTIDHKNEDGSQHRAETGLDGFKIYLWLFKNDFPPEFQALCFNCNIARSQNGGICPHQQRPSTPKLLRHKAKQQGKVTLKCAICRKQFQRAASRAAVAKVHVCTQRCRIALIRRRGLPEHLRR